MIGFQTLFFKEILRFSKVSTQTICAPILTAVLYLLIFKHTSHGHINTYYGVQYTSFLIPGLVMMSILQNSFANSSSSLTQSKVTGSLVFIMLSPLAYWEVYSAYVLASAVRGLVVGLGVFSATMWFGNFSNDFSLVIPWWIIVFSFLGAILLGTIGLIVGIWAERFEQLSAVQSFFIMPSTFLAGVFYSTKSLPVFWQSISRFNPFFYMIDGFRYGFFGQSDIAPMISLTITGAFLAIFSIVALQMLKCGYKLRC